MIANLLIYIMKELHVLLSKSLMKLVIHANLAVLNVGRAKMIRILA